MAKHVTAWLAVSKEEWRERYIQRLMDVTQCDLALAEDTYEAGLDDHDYTENPEYSADMEASYWQD